MNNSNHEGINHQKMVDAFIFFIKHNISQHGLLEVELRRKVQ